MRQLLEDEGGFNHLGQAFQPDPGRPGKPDLLLLAPNN